jgi:hypothetical protein
MFANLFLSSFNDLWPTKLFPDIKNGGF